MIALTAILRAKSGEEERLRELLVDVCARVERHEPGTAAYFIGRDPDEPTVFTTYERYVDRAAMDAHNASPAVKAFFDVATEVLDGAAVIHVTDEIAAKS
jgi:quinol monooxygenase YgiN